MGLKMACFLTQSCQGFSRFGFQFQVPNEEEAEESISEDEADPGVFSGTPNFVPLPLEAEVPVEASYPLSHIGASLSDFHDLEARTTEAIGKHLGPFV